MFTQTPAKVAFNLNSISSGGDNDRLNLLELARDCLFCHLSHRAIPMTEWDSARAATYRRRAIELIVQAQQEKDENTRQELVDRAYALLEAARRWESPNVKK